MKSPESLCREQWARNGFIPLHQRWNNTPISLHSSLRVLGTLSPIKRFGGSQGCHPVASCSSWCRICARGNVKKVLSNSLLYMSSPLYWEPGLASLMAQKKQGHWRQPFTPSRARLTAPRPHSPTGSHVACCCESLGCGGGRGPCYTPLAQQVLTSTTVSDPGKHCAKVSAFPLLSEARHYLIKLSVSIFRTGKSNSNLCVEK